jgi:sterol desaturase/sphingolipid hydroxylase (fatty acid hydroxylase superfamily)
MKLPQQVIHHSFIDGSFQVLTNVIVLRTLGLHPLTRALHNVAVTYMLTETHSGYDMPWMLHNVLPHSILGGSPAHEEHHRGGIHHYQQFFLYLDWLVGAIAKNKNSTSSIVNTDEKKTKGKSNQASVQLRPPVMPVI